jgi:hypothetical protein
MVESAEGAEVALNSKPKLNLTSPTSTTNPDELTSASTGSDIEGSIASTIDSSEEATSSVDSVEVVPLVILEPPELIKDPLAILFFALGPAIWTVMAIQSFKFAALAIVCHVQIGFFLLLVSLGYRRQRAVKATLAGIGLCAVLSTISWFY